MMSLSEIRAYLTRLRPYLIASVVFFGVGFAIALMIVNRFPQMAESFETSLASFVKNFRGLPKFGLFAAIFINNTLKTLLAILLGTVFAVLPTFFLIVNGMALGVVMSLSTQSRGLWQSLLSVLPHGVIELSAVFLGTASGIMLGVSVLGKLFRKRPMKFTAELSQSFKFFYNVIVPLLFVAALVEAYVTAELATR
ncbi:MAG: stage II sporulation protein M [Deltaproteobacteria bacterium]|nr:stage II sporulation protein M [Deltaproteobacteria bacterium]